MSGFTPKVPLYVSSTDGFYALTQNLRENTKQSLKMIVLTAPGERIMNPLFGVGLRRYLFENYSKNLARSFQAKLNEQVERYLPLVKIIDVKFLNSERENSANSAMDPNILAIEINYAITNLNVYDSLFIEDITTGI
jgi:phage baseplate assembly protein W